MNRAILGASFALLCLFAGCSTPEKVVTYPAKPPEEAPPPEPVPTDESALRRARLLADMLYDAKNAFDDNRLMLPAGNSAYDLYQQVLVLDPGNAVALQGIEEIVLRYVSLADDALNTGKYDEAGGLLDRAARLNRESPAVADGRNRLLQARQNRVDVVELDPQGLRDRSLEVMSTLAEIAQRIQSDQSTFLIRARTDEEGRWIYKTMREAVGGYRLRGNIDIASDPGLVITNTPATMSGGSP